MILVIDNYDSFVYNLVQYLGEMGEELRVARNDMVTLKDIEDMKPEYILISPGPGRPENAGISCELIEHFKGKIPILGVCLGHQCIGQVFGAKIVRASKIVHGKTSLIYHYRKGIFKGVTNPFLATRYHSLIVYHRGLPKSLQITAKTEEGEIMGLRHRQYQIYGVQFHPESILTEEGKKILRNFLNLNRQMKPRLME